MPGATILFADIVGFSRKPTDEQRRLVTSLTTEVQRDTRQLIQSSEVVALPTGDGLVLAFLHEERRTWSKASVFALIHRLHRWAKSESTHTSEVKLRIGVHMGIVESITDINGKPNICGDAINYAQRVMDAANPCQTLLSDTAFRELIGAESPTYTETPFSVEQSAQFVGPMEVSAKHGLRIPVYKMLLDPPEDWWNNNDPVAKDHLLVTLTPLPKEIVGDFSDRLAEASDIAFIQLTGDRFLDKFESNRFRLNVLIRRFWVFMPNPTVYTTFHISGDRALPVLVSECVVRWRRLFARLREHSPKADLKLGLFSELPYFGASYVNWEQPDGEIHVSPYVWGIPAPMCPGYDLKWIGKKPSTVYGTYVEGLRYLHSKTVNSAFEGL